MDGVGRVSGQGGEPVGESARSRQRDSLFMTAQLRLPGLAASFEVRVRNLSEGGLMMELDRPLEPGTAVALEMRGLGPLTGTVAWCTRGRVGVALDHPVDPKRARKPVSAGAAAGQGKPTVYARVPKR